MNQPIKLSPAIQKAIDLLDYNQLTPVQQAVIPPMLAGQDVIVKSKTGSGKTAAFAIPLCERVDWEENAVQALVLTPTRELAVQIRDDIFHIGRFKRIKCAALYGKDSFLHQEKELKQKTHIAVGTPGRVLDHLSRGTLYTQEIKYLVIDEADQMLDMGFIDQVTEIIQALPTDRVTVLLSATMSQPIAAMAKKYMKNPIQVEILPKIEEKGQVDQLFYGTTQEEKLGLLRAVTVLQQPDSCIIFCNTQVAVTEVGRYLSRQGYGARYIHGGMEQDDRNAVLEGFRRGQYRYLVATDVAARGIDVADISLVVNFDMPKKTETYIHRIGRTGRIGKTGTAISLVTAIGQSSLEALRRFQGQPLPLLPVPTAEQVAAAQASFDQKMRIKQEEKAAKGAKLGQDILKIHINAGKKTKMRPVDIVGTLCQLEGMTADDIGIIQVLDVSTFVEILNGKGRQVLKELQTRPIKGRLRTVSVVEEERQNTYRPYLQSSQINRFKRGR